jgi:hypothetical protein
MYDKYNKARPFSLNADLPVHKGILLTHTLAGGATFEFFNSAGGTFNGNVYFAANTFNILPMEAHRVIALTGTGYLLN